MRFTPGTGELEWSRTHLPKRQGQINVQRADDVELDNRNPIHCWGQDDGQEEEEWIIRHYCPPTTNFSAIAPSESMQPSYQTLPNLGLQGRPGGQISFLLRTMTTIQETTTMMGSRRIRNTPIAPSGPWFEILTRIKNGVKMKPFSALEVPLHES